MRKSKFVNEFNIGDGISLYGYRGTVIDVYHWTDEGKNGTYVKVAFDDPANVGYQYEGGNFGGLDGVVSYGYFDRGARANETEKVVKYYWAQVNSNRRAFCRFFEVSGNETIEDVVARHFFGSFEIVDSDEVTKEYAEKHNRNGILK